MAKLTLVSNLAAAGNLVTPSLVFVDSLNGETKKRAEIQYDKLGSEELWEAGPSGVWSKEPINEFTRTGRRDDAARYRGNYATDELSPGMTYQVCVTERDHGPLSGQFVAQAYLIVFCLLKTPKEGAQIGEDSHTFGGTWSRHVTPTKVPTYIIMIGVSRKPADLDGEGIPSLDLTFSDGRPTRPPNGPPPAPPTTSTVHIVEINSLLPGNLYFFTVLVADTSGNWEVRQGRDSPYSFTTLRRQLTVEFPMIHIFNDGDWATTGEGTIEFGVLGVDYPKFVWSNNDMDDWGESETGRPYVLLDGNGAGFKHVGKPEKVEAQLAKRQVEWDRPRQSEFDVIVYSEGTEDDIGIDDNAGGLGSRTHLPLPIGMSKESVSNQNIRMDCRGRGVSFHYGIDVVWSVTYVP